MNTRIAVLPGDGIGPEIMPQAIRVLETVGEVCGHTFELTSAQVGGSAIDTKGFPLPVGPIRIAGTTRSLCQSSTSKNISFLDRSVQPQA
jgi:3-isopropylmalate dehydrogenase